MIRRFVEVLTCTNRDRPLLITIITNYLSAFKFPNFGENVEFQSHIMKMNLTHFDQKSRNAGLLYCRRFAPLILGIA